MAVAQAEKILAQDPSNGAALSFGARGYAALGQADNGEGMDGTGDADRPDNLDMRYNFACALAAFLGDREGALRLLERNFATVGSYQVRIAETDPDLDSLRGDPRFQSMLACAKERLGIAADLAGPASDGRKSMQIAVASVSNSP